MRIAMVCPLDGAVSPTAAGNPHRTIGELSSSLVDDGHRVTLFAAEGSSGGTHLVPCPGTLDGEEALTLQLREAFQLAGVLDGLHGFDLVHNHAGPAPAVLLSGADLPVLSTIHRPCSPEEKSAFHRLGEDALLVGGSPGVVPNGLPLLGTVLPGPELTDGYLGIYREVLDRRENFRPWGHYVVLEDHPRHKVKRIVVDPGQRLSLQLHYRRAEHWLVIEGQGLVTLDDEEILLGPNQAVDIPSEARHRIRNPGNVRCVFIEVQTGDYFGEDDIVRLEDDYGRNES